MATAPAANQKQDVNDRDYRAACEYILVVKFAPGMYKVYSKAGEEYVVDVQEGACTCPDAEYRGVRCKHRRRVEMERGERAVPTDVRIDPILADRIGRRDV